MIHLDLPLFLAHAASHSASGFVSGLTHPILGLDHLLAMLAVGIWAVQLGGRSLWALPVGFLAAMTVGGVLGMASVPLPLIEPAILGSVLLIGLLAAMAVRVPAWAGAAIVAGFALFHGSAHGAEMPGGASSLTYALGFLLATAALHGAGLMLGVVVQGAVARNFVLRGAGAAIATCGMVILAQNLVAA